MSKKWEESLRSRTPEQRREEMAAARELSAFGVNVESWAETSPSRQPWSELHNERKTLGRALRAMIDRCDKESRDFTESEKLAYNGGRDVLANLSKEIERRGESGNHDPLPMGGGFARGRSRASGHGNGALSRDENLSDFVATVPGEEVGLGSLLKASVTGEWNGLEQYRAQQGGSSGAAGGFLVPTYLSSRIIDLSRMQARVIQAGAMTVPISGATSFGTVEQDPTGYWRGENEAVTESEMVFGSRTFTPKTLAVLVRSSLELIEDAPNIEALIETAIAAELALKLDRMALIGDGVAKPLGLFYTDGINRLSADGGSGALTDYSLLSRAVEAVRNNNAEPGAFLLAARTNGEIDRLTDQNDNPLRPPRSIQERNFLTTNQIATNMTVGGSPPITNASAIFTGQWEDLYVAMRTGIVIEASRVADTAMKNMQVMIRGYLRADAFAIRPAHFAVVEGITPPA